MLNKGQSSSWSVSEASFSVSSSSSSSSSYSSSSPMHKPVAIEKKTSVSLLRKERGGVTSCKRLMSSYYATSSVNVKFLTSGCAAHVSFWIITLFLERCYNVIIIIFYYALTLKKIQMKIINVITSTHTIGQWWVQRAEGTWREVAKEKKN